MTSDTALLAKINELFQGRTDKDEIIEAFSFEHEFENKRFQATATVTLGTRDDIEIRGTFTCLNAEPKEAGSFYRRLHKRGGSIVCHHARIFVVPEHRLHRLATTHYVKLFRFYDRVGVEGAYMEADEYGPVIWPGFGFSLKEQRDRDRYDELLKGELAKHVGTESSEKVLQEAGGFTPLQAAIEVEAVEGSNEIPVGLLAMRDLYEEHGSGNEIQMVIWLTMPKVREFLQDAGIL